MPRWTPEARERHSILMKTKIRLWQPWLQSTGAKTAEGKARSSRNAYKHGCCSQESIQMMREIREMIRHNNQAFQRMGQADFW